MPQQPQITEQASNPKDPKELIIKGILKSDGNCDVNLHYSNLNPEQLAKLTLYLMNYMTDRAFKKLAPFVDHRAYGTRIQIPVKDITPNQGGANGPNIDPKNTDDGDKEIY